MTSGQMINANSTENGRIVRRTNLTSHDQVFVAVSVDYLYSSELICLSA